MSFKKTSAETASRHDGQGGEGNLSLLPTIDGEVARDSFFSEPGVVVFTGNLSTWKAEARGS